MEFQKLTEELFRTLFTLRSVGIQRLLQDNFKGEGYLLSYLATHHGESTPGDLRNALGVSGPRTTAMLRALEEKGLLNRHVNGRDHRRVVVTMTTAGESEAAERRLETAERLRRMLEQLGESDAREFVRILGRFAEIEGIDIPGEESWIPAPEAYGFA